MGVASLVFEPHPPNFENYFLTSLLVSDFERSVWSVPSISVAVLGLVSLPFQYVNLSARSRENYKTFKA